MQKFFFLIVLASWLASFRLNAQTQAFELVYGGEDSQEAGIGSIQLPDGNIYMLGNILSDTTAGQDVLLLKINPMGEVIWAKSYDNGESEFAQDFILKNGVFIIAGESNEINGFGKDGFILRVDLAGNLVSFDVYGQAAKSEQFQSIASTGTGYVVCGYVTADNNMENDVLVRHFGMGILDSWEMNLGVPGNDIGMAIAQMPDGNFMLCGDRRIDSLKYNPFVMLLSERGELLNEAILSSPYNGGSKNLTFAGDGNLLVVGEMATPSSMAFDVFVAKISPQAEVLWVNYVPSTDASDAGFGLCAVNAGSLVITGYSFNEAEANSDIVAISVDSTGGEIERKYFGGPGLDIAYDVEPSLAGGLLITGKTAKPNHQDAILIHDFLTLATTVAEPQLGVGRLDISPNPAVANSLLRLPETWHGADWQVLDIYGRKMVQGTVNQAIAIGDMIPGTYFLWVKKPGASAAGRLVILK